MHRDAVELRRWIFRALRAVVELRMVTEAGSGRARAVSRVFSSLSLRGSEGGTRASQRKRTSSLSLAREAPFTDRARVAGKLLPSARRGSVHTAIIREAFFPEHGRRTKHFEHFVQHPLASHSQLAVAPLCRGSPRQSCQLTTVSPGTRSNSRTFRVTIVAP